MASGLMCARPSCSWGVVQKTVGCSRSTISKAVRFAGRTTRAPALASTPASLSVTVILWLHVENGSKFTRGKKRVREDVGSLVTRFYDSTKLNDAEYRLVIRYANDADLEERLDGLLHEICHLADLRNCVVDDISVKNEANGLYWDECDGGWK
ncbi:resolvase [Xanthomonas hortorum pv. vitians]|nr:resolvase [Xanthomonas hortorum pv. vitians]